MAHSLVAHREPIFLFPTDNLSEMSTAIVPAKIAQILPLEVFTIERGGRNSVALASGKVASDIELLGYDERNRIARYELRVANESASTLACYAYAVRGSTGERPITCTSIAVLPFSGVAVTFELPLPFVGNYDRITVEMHGDGIDLSSDTVPPGRDYRVLVRRSAILAAAVFGALFTAVVGLLQPHIVAISAPSAAPGGAIVKIAYEARGLGKLTYDLTSPDGLTIEKGHTTAHSGTIAVNLPAVPTSRSYIVSLEEHNLFGGDARVAIIKDLATPPPRMFTHVLQSAAIRSLSLDRSRVASGEHFLVRYSYVAQTGLLRLIDDKDSVSNASPIDPKGITSFVAPAVGQAEQMRIALHVEKDTTSADSEVGITVVPATPPPLEFKAIAGSPLEIIARPTFAGDSIPLRVRKNVADLHIALQDPHGVNIEDFNVDGDQTALHAPSDSAGHTYTIVITFTDRNGQETVVKPIVVQANNR